MEHAVSPNRPQVGSRGDPSVHATDVNGSWAEVNMLGSDRLHIYPALNLEDAEDRPEDGLDDHQDPGHVDGDDDVAANEHLQRIEQADLTAVRNILGQPIRGNAITVRHLWQVLKKLRGDLAKGGGGGGADQKVMMMPKLGQDYARILERMARVMTIPGEQDYKSALGVHPDLPYECASKLLKERKPDFSCPLDDGEFLDRVCEDLTATFSVMRVAEGIFVVKDRDRFARRFRGLGARLQRLSLQ